MVGCVKMEGAGTGTRASDNEQGPVSSSSNYTGAGKELGAGTCLLCSVVARMGLG